MRPEEPTPQRRSSDPPAIAALRELKEAFPDLAPAADLQIELTQITRRVSARAPLPALAPTDVRQARVNDGARVLSFSDFRFDWSAVRLAVREVARALEAVGALQEDEAKTAENLVRGETAELERCLQRWFNGEPLSEGLQEVLDTAMRPFMARAASAALTGLDLSAWKLTTCPACGAQPDFAVIAKDARRHLSCHRCRAQWPCHSWACPRCNNDDQSTISSFASRDGLYRIYACGQCKRYLKAFDCRTAPRQLLADVDLIATLPLDAAAVQKGFTA
ncbi:MAG: formate dehydrogenase accessory protein FdhE [Vicinamibacterales bacterium]